MEKFSRRDLLRKTAMAGSGALFWSLASVPAFSEPTNDLLPASANPQALSYFTQAESDFVNAALSRLVPADNLGPGAREAGVGFFIDQQMVSPYGRAERWYMQGPWKDGSKEQGYQLKLTPAQLYRTAIRGIDSDCKTKYGKFFAQLAPAQQDEILHALENGDIHLTDVPAKEFFGMLLQNTMEGFLADPMYGGNRDFIGWKLIGFPGPRYNYVEDIERYGKPYPNPPVGLTGRSGRIAGKG